MVTGPDFIFIIQAVIIVVIIFVVSHELLSKPIDPISLIILIFGLVALQLSNTLIFSFYDSFVLSEFSSMVFIGPIIEELSKFMIIIYLIYRTNDEMEIVLHSLLVGLGFGIGELIGYTVVFGTYILLERSILLFFGHPLLGVIMGYWIKQIEKSESNNNLVIVKIIGILIIVIGLHIFWNMMSLISLEAILLPIVLNLFIFYNILKRLYASDTSGLESSGS